MISRILITLFIILTAKSVCYGKEDKWINKSLSDMTIMYFGFSNEMGSFQGQEAYFWGFDIGTLLDLFDNNKFLLVIGAGGTWLDNSIENYFEINDSTSISYPVNYKMGGIRIGLKLFDNLLFSPSFDCLFAGGDLRYQVSNEEYKRYKAVIGMQVQEVFSIMPKINLEIKISKNVTFGWGLSFRKIYGKEPEWSKYDELEDFGYHGLFKLFYRPDKMIKE